MASTKITFDACGGELSAKNIHTYRLQWVVITPHYRFPIQFLEITMGTANIIRKFPFLESL